VGCPRDENRGANQERTRYGQSQYRSGGRSWSDASRALPFLGSQDSVKEMQSRALAGRKLEAPPDAGHEPREGETVRGIALTIKNVSAGSACGFRLAGSRYDGRCSRADVRMTLTGHAKQRSFGSQVNLSHAIREERATDSTSVGTEAGRVCLRVTTRASDGRRGSVKAPRGPRRAERGPHPRH
jgi:hypothetical protein